MGQPWHSVFGSSWRRALYLLGQSENWRDVMAVYFRSSDAPHYLRRRSVVSFARKPETILMG